MQDVAVTYLDDRQVKTKVHQIDYVRFERSQEYLADRPVLALWWTTYSALKRDGQVPNGGTGKPLSFNGWADTVAEVDPLTEEEEPDPTQSAPPSGSASGSRSRSTRTRSGSSSGTTG